MTVKAVAKSDKEKIRLGSGKLYIDALPETLSLASPYAVMQFIQRIIADENKLLGLISGGAAIEYTKSTQTVKDDLEIVSKTVITTEDVSLTSGVMTWNGTTLAKICETARVSEDPIAGLRMVKIGGIANADGKIYVLLFVHEDPQDGNVYSMIVGKNTSGFKFEFKKEDATVIDVTFTAESMDDEGTKLVLIEDIPASNVFELTAKEGSTKGNTAITVSGAALEAGESYAYKVVDSALMPEYLGKADGYTAWTDGDITADAGKYVVIVGVNADSEIVKAGVVKAVPKGEAA